MKHDLDQQGEGRAISPSQFKQDAISTLTIVVSLYCAASKIQGVSHPTSYSRENTSQFIRHAMKKTFFADSWAGPDDLHTWQVNGEALETEEYVLKPRASSS